MKLKLHERLAVALLKGLRCLSLKTLYHVTCVIYFMLKPFPLRVKKTIARNLECCLPGTVSPDAVLFHTFWRIVEMPFFWFSSKKALDKVFLKVTDEDQFQAEFSEGAGAIVITSHFGAWEMVNAYMGPRYPCVTLYKPLRHAYQEELVRIARERYGVEFFEASMGGVKKVFESLKQGKCLGIMSDHDPGENGGIFVPFFGVPANTMTLPIKLIQKSKANVYTLSAERLPKGRGFHLRFTKVEGLRGVSVEEATTRMNEAIENIVMQAPEQYEWSYKRFRRTEWEGRGFYVKMPPTSK